MVKPIYKYLIISVLWYFWHFDFGIDLNHLISYGYILAGSVGIGYVAEKTKSLVLPSMFHMVYNVFFSNIEDVFFYQKAIILIVCIVVIILIMRIDIIKQKKTNNLIHSKLVL